MYSITKTYEDGNCFFRCIAIHMNKYLLSCDRYQNGRCKNRNLFSKETSLSDSLRDICVNYICENKHKYINKKINGCLMYLENETIEDHVKRMGKSGEFAENLELQVISDLFNLNILVWVINDDNTLNLVANIGKNHHQKTNLLLLDNMHYDFLTLDNDYLEKKSFDNIQLENIKKESTSVSIIYPKDLDADTFIPYKLKTINTKDGFLIKTKHIDVEELIKSGLKISPGIKIDDNLWFFERTF